MLTSIDEAADEILGTVVNVVRAGEEIQAAVLDGFPIAVYVTDLDGFITYFNPACIDFAGRTPVVGKDRWCVSWKLYTARGDFLPHERCPMAAAVKTSQTVRGVTAVAERPNGERISFAPFPTPVIGDDGKPLCAVNMLVDVEAPGELKHNLQMLRSAFIEAAIADLTLEDIRTLKQEMELALAVGHHGSNAIN